MVVGGTALFGGGRGSAAQSKAMVEIRAGKMTTQTGIQVFFIYKIGVIERVKSPNVADELN